MIRIVIADDQTIVRQGLRALLETTPDFCVVGEAGDGLEAVALVERFEPDVLMIELALPGLSGLEAARRVSAQTRVVVLSAHLAEFNVVDAVKNGAIAYVPKNSSAEQLFLALRGAAGGTRHLGLPLSDDVVDEHARTVTDPAREPLSALTNREREVLQLVAEGYTSCQVGRRLSISRRTAEAHRANMMRKLGLRSLSDLIRVALVCGLVPTSGPRFESARTAQLEEAY